MVGSKALWESPAVNKYKMVSGGAGFEPYLCHQKARNLLTSEFPFIMEGALSAIPSI